MMDGCVTEFGLRAPLLREHRQLLRAAADARLREPSNKELHDSSIRFCSSHARLDRW